mmetsp:Transcript_34206/g.89757  ORF Transcript_34206/g.89757 Transcript_34206/m.89757 type:complete len:360 (-) Transcript_34206:62-1141(-)
MRRVSRREKVAEVITRLDAFPKTMDDAKETSSSGGAATMFAALLIVVLVGSEVMYYSGTEVQYKYEVDRDFRRDMKMWIDITIKMKCEHLGADYVDVSGNSSEEIIRGLQMEPSHFELAPNQKEWLETFHAAKAHMGSRGLDSLQRFLKVEDRASTLMPEASSELAGETDSCRIHGAIPIAKVAANFHITAGKSIHHARGHAHLTHTVPPNEINFSHRIDRLSFSDEEVGGHTLDGDTQAADEHTMMYQYFIKVVPTSTQALGQAVPFHSNQYSVTEQVTVVNPQKGAHGLPGIYFKYDLEPMTVQVVEVRKSLMRFLVRLCGIAGGVFATSGMLHQTISNMVLSFKPPHSNLPSQTPQ